MKNKIEIWKDIVDYEGIYQVSDFGRIKSLSRIRYNIGKYPFLSKDKILIPCANSDGYLTINLCKDGKSKNKKVHQLVAIAFLNHIPDGGLTQVDHIKEGNKLDNRAENLQLLTKRGNVSKYKKTLKNTSEHTGVYWDKRRNKWCAQIQINKKHIHLGFFISELEASEYYENALLSIKNGNEIIIKKIKGTSKHKGVSLDKKSKKWKSSIQIKGERKYLGLFQSEIEASNAYQKELLNNL